MLSIYHDALLRFFSLLRWGHMEVPVVVAGADRAHAQVKQWLLANKGIQKSEAEAQTALPYPFAAIWKERWKEFKELSNPRSFRILDSSQKYGFAMKAPKPVHAGFSVNFYCEDLEQAEHLEYQVQNLFPQGDAYVPIDFADEKWYAPPNDVFTFAKMLGNQDVYLTMESLVDNSNLEDAGLNQREVRMTLSGKIYGWIPFQPYAVPIARGFIMQLCDLDTEEIYKTVDLSFEE